MGPTMSDAMDSDAREVIRRRIALRERDGHERLLLNHEALRALLDAADERDRLAAAVERVRVLHVGGWGCGNPSHTNPAVGCPDCFMECGSCGEMCPCPTLRALDGTDA